MCVIQACAGLATHQVVEAAFAQMCIVFIEAPEEFLFQLECFPNCKLKL